MVDPVVLAARALAPALTGGGKYLHGRLRIRRSAWDARTWDKAVRALAADCGALRHSEFASMDDAAWARAVEAAAEALTAMDRIDGRLTLRQAMNPGSLAQHVLDVDARRPDRADVRDIRDAYARIVELACVELVGHVRRSPEFPSAVAIEQLARLERIEELVEPPGAARLLDFERRYRESVARTLDRLELFGVTLKDPDFRYPMSTAYVSLSVESTDDSAATRPFRQRIEDVLVGRRRVLVRGEAGSGKTTLLQRLAVWAARDGFPPELAERTGTVPFFLPLRHFSFTDEAPGPEDFLDHTGRMLSAEQPEGWVRSLLHTGRAMVLIDGLDEIAGNRRMRVADWIAELCAQYPRAWFVVSSRPSAIPREWLADQHFVSVRLQSMEIADQRAFIEHWYGAVPAEVSDDQASPRAYREDLVDKLLTRRHLRRLAANPLLCALICALHRERRMEVPDDRIKLYEAALEMLLVRRDQARKVVAAEAALLGDRAQEAMLRQFACWMVRNDYTEVTREQARDRLGRYLARTAGADLDTDRVLTHLLERSGVLREPSPGYVDFVHRTFQEFLAARQLLDDGDLGLLVKNADEDDRWREVFTMAVGLGRERERDQLIRELLGRARRSRRHRDNLLLLAADAVGNAPTLDPRLRVEVARRSASLLPPATVAQARRLATLGEVVLDRLPPPTLPLHRPTVELAKSVGGAIALEFLGRVATLTRTASDEDATEVTSVLLGASWAFSPQDYGAAVLARLRVPDTVVLRASSPVDIEQFRHLRNAPMVHVHTEFWSGHALPVTLASSFRRVRVVHTVTGGGPVTIELPRNPPAPSDPSRLEQVVIDVRFDSGPVSRRPEPDTARIGIDGSDQAVPPAGMPSPGDEIVINPGGDDPRLLADPQSWNRLLTGLGLNVPHFGAVPVHLVVDAASNHGRPAPPSTSERPRGRA